MESFNFGAFDPTIGARIAAIPQEAQKQQTANMLQAMQMQGAMRQNEMSQMQLDEMKTDRAEMVKLQQDLAAKGGSPDLGQYADMLMRSPKHMKLGIELKQKLNEQAQFARIMGEPARATAPAIAPAPAPAAAPMAAPEPGSFGADVAARTAAVPAWAQNNALAPTAAPIAPTNALMAGSEAVDALRQKRNALLSLGTTQSIAAARAIDADIALLAKEPVYHTVTGVGLVNSRDKSVVVPSVETAPNSIRELEAFMKMTPQQQDTFMKMKRASAGGTTVNVSTEKKYGEAFGGKLAEKDIAAFTTAEKAPQLAESANRIIDIVKNGNIFVGPVADIKLNIARAMNVTGATNQEKIANTESLVAATGQSTLDAIKNAGLGTGQGFTDKDLGFLRGIAGGTINLTEKTLTELATLQHRAATRSAEAWNKRVNEMPSEVVKGTGLSTAPIKVPALSAVAPMPIFAINPQTGARIQSIDGGNTWKPAGVK